MTALSASAPLVSDLVMPSRGDRFKVVKEDDFVQQILDVVASGHKQILLRVKNGDHLTVDDLGLWSFEIVHLVIAHLERRHIVLVGTWINPSLSLPIERRRVSIETMGNGAHKCFVRFL